MKFTKKASVPIGTIAIIIIVLVAGLGIWWYFTQDGDTDCSDVRYWDTAYGRRWNAGTMSGSDYYPTIDRDDRDTQLNHKWGITYKDIGGTKRSSSWPTLEQLESVIDNLSNTSDETKNTAHHIIDCIQAGCPDCRRA